jgi:predicted flap endonuclease-1-like 5' DNA nuclease
MEILLQEMWPCLLVATLIGTVIGWWLRRCKKSKRVEDDQVELYALESANTRSKTDTASFSSLLWEEQKKSLDEEIIALRMKLSKAETQMKAADTKLAAVEHEYAYKLKRHEENFYDRDRVIKKLKKELYSAEKRVQGLEHSLKEMQSSYDEKLQERDVLLQKAEERLVQEKDQRTKIALQAHYYENEISTLQKSIEASTKDGEKFQLLERDEKEKASKEIARVKSSYDMKLSELRDQLSKKERQIESLEVSLQKAKELPQEDSKKLQQTLDEQEKIIDRYKEEIKELKESLKEEQEISSKKLYVLQNDHEFQIKKAHNEVKSSETQLEGLKEKLLRTQQLVETYKKEKEDLEKRLSELENSQKESTQEEGTLEEKLVQASMNNIKYSQEIAILKEQVAQIDPLKEEIERLKSQFSTQQNSPTNALRKPTFLLQPEGKADNLQLIKGIGKKLEKVLNELGVFHFRQIASWSESEVAWVNEHLAFSGRIEREEWIAQAKTLMKGEKTEFSKRVESGEIPTSDGGVKRGFKHEKRLHKK